MQERIIGELCYQENHGMKPVVIEMREFASIDEYREFYEADRDATHFWRSKQCQICERCLEPYLIADGGYEDDRGYGYWYCSLDCKCEHEDAMHADEDPPYRSPGFRYTL